MLKTIKKLSYKHSTHKVFTDFLETSACAISNSIDRVNYEKRENQVLEIYKGYLEEEKRFRDEGGPVITYTLKDKEG